jgi:murein DD-endopeptidase MepM/ murein hydrolase activator NlpD
VNLRTNNTNINIPIKAAAAGTVTIAQYSSTAGNYVEISHGTTGFKTRYMHMRANLQVAVGQTVAQGQTLGYMWTSGESSGSHLHFDVKYNGDGTMESNDKYLTMEGLLLKSYQTECSVNGSGWATDYRRYYQSTNSI